jgi:hypothetical protein
MPTLTETPLLGAFALHTHTAKFASLPAVTCEEVEKDWTRTHTCAVGADELLGVGVGVGLELGAGEMLVVGLELAVAFLDDELGLGVGLALRFFGLVLLLAVGLADAELLVVGRIAGVVLLSGEIAASSSAPFGTDEHAELTIGEFAALAARVWPSQLTDTNAKPVTALATTGLTSCALISETLTSVLVLIGTRPRWYVLAPHNYALAAGRLLVRRNSYIRFTVRSSGGWRAQAPGRFHRS